MLRKRNSRVQAFSTCHAALLAAFIVLAQIMGLGSAHKEARYSDRDTITPSAILPYVQCSEIAETADNGACGVIIRAKHDVNDHSGVVMWRFGVRL
ncbi:hypothetical protein [uncultured Marivita sp.]|uniref:hypothetical protein n=1 Tax=uncultured Marivita sp. TaxID=888080 RepID=UPI002603DFAA|nr:hypothetical protein [uncultured Marivita sp.]